MGSDTVRLSAWYLVVVDDDGLDFVGSEGLDSLLLAGKDVDSRFRRVVATGEAVAYAVGELRRVCLRCDDGKPRTGFSC